VAGPAGPRGPAGPAGGGDAGAPNKVSINFQRATETVGGVTSVFDSGSKV
jgi:hypothetical protein